METDLDYAIFDGNNEASYNKSEGFMQTNSTNSLVTAIAVIVALAAVVWGFMAHMGTTEITKIDSYEVSDQNPVVLEVEGKKVTRQEILDNFNQSKSGIPQGISQQQLFPLLQEQYVATYMLTEAAKDAGINSKTPEVERALQMALEQAIRAVYLQKGTGDMVSDEDVQKAYEDVIAKSPDVMERMARHILVKDEATAKSMIEKLDGGADFAELAKKNSTGPSAPNGGEIGYFTKDQMVPEFSKAAFDLKVGSYTKQPVKTQFGWHVIKVEDERVRAKPSLEQVHDQIAQQIRQKMIAQQIQEMRKEADVVLYDINGNPIPQPEAEADADAGADAESTPVADEETEAEESAE